MIFRFTTLLLFIATLVEAQETTPYDFLKTEPSAVSAGLSGSNLFLKHAAGTWSNPATGMFVPNRQALFGYSFLPAGGGTMFAEYAHPMEGSTISGFVFNQGYGVFERTNADGVSMGSTFSVNSFAIGASFAAPLADIDSNWYGGATIKYIHTGIDGYSSNAVATDLGILYTIPKYFIGIGASVLNLGTQLSSYNGVKEDMPTDLRIGFTKKLEYLPLEFSVAFKELNVQSNTFFERFGTFAVGGEFTLGKVIRLMLALDAHSRRDLKLSTSTGTGGFTLGTVVTVKKYQMHFTMNSLGKLATFYRISVTANL